MYPLKILHLLNLLLCCKKMKLENIAISTTRPFWMPCKVFLGWMKFHLHNWRCLWANAIVLFFVYEGQFLHTIVKAPTILISVVFKGSIVWWSDKIMGSACRPNLAGLPLRVWGQSVDIVFFQKSERAFKVPRVSHPVIQKKNAWSGAACSPNPPSGNLSSLFWDTCREEVQQERSDGGEGF